MNITLHEAIEADLPAILSLYAQLGEDDGAVLNLAQAGRIFARIRTYPDYRLYIARRDDRIVGTFALLIMDNLGHQGARSAILEDVVVANELRGQGIGRSMVLFANRLCQAKDCYKLALSSNRNREAAHRFYESLGFVRHGFSYAIAFPPAGEAICEAVPENSSGHDPVFQPPGQIL